MRLDPRQLVSLLAQARQGSPREVCGWLLLDSDGAVCEIRRAQNVAVKDWAFEMDPDSLMEAVLAEEAGQAVAVYHSHPHSVPVPSNIDISEHAYTWPFVIVGLKPHPAIRVWEIKDGWFSELPLVVG